MRGFFSEDFLLVFGQHVPAEVSLLDGRTQRISCLFLPSSDWKAGSSKLTLQKWPVFVILEAAYEFFHTTGDRNLQFYPGEPWRQ